MKIMTREEAITSIRDGTVTAIDGRKPVAVGLLDHERAVLLMYVHPDAERSPTTWRGASEYAVWREEDAL
jgi:hypothetical protein